MTTRLRTVRVTVYVETNKDDRTITLTIDSEDAEEFAERARAAIVELVDGMTE